MRNYSPHNASLKSMAVFNAVSYGVYPGQRNGRQPGVMGLLSDGREPPSTNLV